MYDFKQIEKKWQNYWASNKTFEAANNSSKDKYYVLVEFPYPSGSGLHVGHVRSYTALDTLARKKRMEGYNVLFPMGWDAFGSPAEQYAIQNHIHPKEAVKENIKTFKAQIQSLGISYDWSREFSTTDEDYYKWTQWQFLKFYEHGMAYKDKKPINWCPNCKVGLSNEDAAGGVCERCGTSVVQKEKSQWMLRMSDYADQLLDGLKDNSFQERIKTAQINWIGKSTGAEVEFKIADTDEVLKVYTTRPDTLYGVTFMVVAPEHLLIDALKDKITNVNDIINYREEASKKSEFERSELTKEKTGVKLEGVYAINPVNNEKIEIWTGDYVMMGYGTGAIMAVPAHDERDYEFAKKYNIGITQVIAPYFPPEPGNEHKEGVETIKRTTVIIGLKHPSEDKYLCLDWKNHQWHTFVVGGIEGNETIEEGALRELKEETGYKNIEIENVFDFETHSSFYAAHKGVNRYQIAKYVVAKLKDLEQEEIDEEEKAKHDLVWIERTKLLDFINLANYTYLAELIINGEKAFIEDGVMINSDILDGIDNKQESIDKMISYLEERGIGKKAVNYRLQDWVFSRQRFWGEPIPMVYCEKCGWVPVPEEQLPVKLPDVVQYEPTDTGESPLALIDEFVNTTCPKCGLPAKRETDTMPNWAGSSWYWLRYMDPNNKDEFVSQEALKYWGKVDWYNGGMEHATRHLLYARFWNQFLYNIGLVPNKEPFEIRTAHGMILGDNGEKMSKSKGNVVNPNDIVDNFGADALRSYEMFIGDYEKEAAWNINGLKGCKRFLDRVWRLQEKITDKSSYSDEILVNKTIKKVSHDIESMKYNTAVSSLMIMVNEYEAKDNITKDDLRILLLLLSPIAPHIAEEINQLNKLGNPLCESPWPTYDESKTVEDTYEMIVQVNGKLRGRVEMELGMSEEEMKQKALEHENVVKYLEDSEIVKIIVVPKKLVNIVVK